MPIAYCEEADVQAVLQEPDSKFGSNELSSGNVQAAIHGASAWFGKQTNGHWYDSTKTASDLVDSANKTASDIRLSIPSSPHRQRGQLIHTNRHLVYPVTNYGPYARITLPHPYVTSITKLEVRDRAGGVTDWVADSGYVEGRGEDYYVGDVGQNSYGRTNLYVRAESIGARSNFTGLVTAEYEHGLDYQSEAWDDVKRGVAALAGAQLVADDDVLAGLPSGANLVGVDTQVEQLVNQALGVRGGEGGYLSPYMNPAVE